MKETETKENVPEYYIEKDSSEVCVRRAFSVNSMRSTGFFYGLKTGLKYNRWLYQFQKLETDWRKFKAGDRVVCVDQGSEHFNTTWIIRHAGKVIIFLSRNACNWDTLIESDECPFRFAKLPPVEQPKEPPKPVREGLNQEYKDTDKAISTMDMLERDQAGAMPDKAFVPPVELEK